MRELDCLNAVRAREVAPTPELEALYQELAAVNRRLWDIEDALRQSERTNDLTSLLSNWRAAYTAAMIGGPPSSARSTN